MKEQYIKLAPLFQGFSEQELESVVAGFATSQNPTGAKLLNAGERSDAIYLLNQGFVRLTNESGYNLATLGPGSILGDASLLRAVPQDVSAVAATDVEYWKLTDRTLRSIILRQPAIGLKLGQNFGGQVAQMEDYLLQRLASINEFGTLPQNTLQSVAAALQPRRLAAGQTLYRVGEKAANLYIVENGSLELREEAEATNPQRAESGSVVGASALLTGKTYTHSAVATADSLMWVLSSETFQAINARHPGLRRSLSHSVRTPLSRSDQTMAATRLGQMPLFAELPPPVLQALAQRILLQHVSAGDRVYRSGDAGDALYMIESGDIELTGENTQGVLEERARIGEGGFFGETSLLNSPVRTEDATARRNSNLWVLTKSELDGLAVKHPAISKALSQGVATQLSAGPNDLERFHRFPLLADLNKDDLRQIVSALRPTRFRSGEQIFRSNAPSDTLYLIERGEVRMQQIGGESWFLGEGEIFGERSLLTNQPNNASAAADTDVDLWTLHKRDFEALTRRNPALGLNMSRVLSDYMRQPTDDQLPYEEDQFDPMPAAANYESPSSNRRRQAGATPLPSRQPMPARTERGGFGQWFGELSLMGKINIILLLLLLVVVIGVLTTTLARLVLGSRVASGASAYAPLDALRQVMQQGSYDVASINQDVARALALADRQVPPTATYTPFPTITPTPQATSEATALPPAAGAQEGVFVENFQAVASEPFALVAQAAVPEAAKQAEPVAMAAAGPAPRVWDSRLDQLGVKVSEASVEPGQPYWRLIEARWEDESQAGGKHHLFVEVRDENGSRVVGQAVTAFWGDGSFTGPTEDKAAPDYAWNYQMYAAGYAYSVKVEGLPSDVMSGAGLGDLNLRFHRIHVAYYLVFQKTTK